MSGINLSSTSVFGFRQDSPYERRLQVGRAMRGHFIDSYLKESNDEEKKEFLLTLVDMVHRFVDYALVSERLLLLFDSCALIDMQKKDEDRKRLCRYSAVLSLLSVTQDRFLCDTFVCVTPAVVYEFNGRQPISSAEEAESVLFQIEELMVDIGLSIRQFGFNDAKALVSITSAIREDEEQIINAIREINSAKWKMNFRLPDGSMQIPLAVAERSIPDVRVTYFHPWYVKLVLMRMVEKLIFEQNKDEMVRSLIDENSLLGISSITKIKKGRLTGLADIELLSYADLSRQTAENSPSIAAAITVDENLMRTLFNRSSAHFGGFSFVGGEDEPNHLGALFQHNLSMSSRREQKSKARIDEYERAFVEFKNEQLWKHFEPLLKKTE